MVSVPVLSVHKMSIAPRFWMECSRLMITFFLDMAIAPLERQTVTIIGSISGVSPTATARAKKKASCQFPFVMPLIRNTNGTITNMKRIISHVKLSTPLSKLVGACCCGNGFCHTAKIGVEPCRYYDGGCRAAFNACAEETKIVEFQR